MTLKEQVDYYSEFKHWYQKITKDFKFDVKKDYKARDLLSEILSKKGKNWKLGTTLNSFKNAIQSRASILIYGCGPSLEITVKNLMREKGNKLLNNCVNLAADGASVLLKEEGIPIDAIFTDLDGITKSEFNYSDFVVVHAHGDNMDKIREFKEDILNFEKIIGTTQAKSLNNIITAGGFTDGDRILYFLRSLLLPEQNLFLIGMDFGEDIGRYSKPEMTDNQKANPIKLKKLQYAVELIEMIIKKIKNEIYFVNSKVISKKFKYISIEEFKKLILE